MNTNIKQINMHLSNHKLEAYDRNFNFEFVAVDNENTAPKMCLLPPETIKDVQGGIKLNIEQCKCAAGEGTQSHCKHITAVILTIAMFCERKVLWIEEACTTQLQTFHQSKSKFNGSPINARELSILGNSNNNDTRFQHSEDKRYKEYFINLCIDFGEYTMSILQLYEPANP
ncbi:unnamed protein product [Psylliodes chrysocephalus]|uniref:SWIM-type domain-containing protein n=1 Tax=Psylliodes chrysocephalus TaxID=3402493 RepID=A0A9P0GF26_9CUCU|nr:unnamed protein product [Psylliodes chrysocephala]